MKLVNYKVLLGLILSFTHSWVCINYAASSESQKVSFSYENKDIVDIINYLAQLTERNVLFPNPISKLSMKISYHVPHKISTEEAWNLVMELLEIGNFSMIPKDDTYIITETKNTPREALPTYINVLADELPDSDVRIRYLYYLQNINIAGNTFAKTSLDTVLKDMLSAHHTIYFDMDANALLLVDKSSNIRSAMHIISVFDQAGIPESAIVVPLVNSEPRTIAEILKKFIPGADGQKNPWDYGPSYGSSPSGKGWRYFSEGTKVVPIDRSRSIAILGKIESVERVKEFIEKYLDKSTGSGKSIIHIKEINYLKAQDLEGPLNTMIKARIGQASQSTGQTPGADEFNDIVVVAEKEERAPQQGVVTTSAPITGGNRLIVAAREQDWMLLEKIIDELDQPQIQVVVEALIVNLDIENRKALGGQSRNAPRSEIPNNLKWQSVQLSTQPWLNYINTEGSVCPAGTLNSAIGLAADLQAPECINGTATSLPGSVEAGSTIITFQNGRGISNILQILDRCNNATILSQPFVITVNHMAAQINSDTTRYVDGSVQQESTGGPVNIQKDKIKANLGITITPRVSHSGNINITLEIKSEDFVSLSSNNIRTRVVSTNANICSNDVLVLGGLTQTTQIETLYQTPILSHIPVLGYFFKKRTQAITKTNLTVFVSATVIHPLRNKTMNEFTHKKVRYTQGEIQAAGEHFQESCDPVARMFFEKPLNNAQEEFLDYTAGKIFTRIPIGVP